LLVLPRRVGAWCVGGGRANPTFSGGKLYEGAALRVPGTTGRGLESAEPVLPIVFTESFENRPRPELGVGGSAGGRGGFSLRRVDFVRRLTSVGSAGTGGASSGESGDAPTYEEATAVPTGTTVVACWNSDGTLIRLAAGEW